jgi:hypothetical protein
MSQDIFVNFIMFGYVLGPAISAAILFGYFLIKRG